MYVKSFSERAKVYGPDTRLLTGQVIHKELATLAGHIADWDELPTSQQQDYHRAASRLRVFLEAEPPESM